MYGGGHVSNENAQGELVEYRQGDEEKNFEDGSGRGRREAGESRQGACKIQGTYVGMAAERCLIVFYKITHITNYKKFIL